MNGVGAVVCEVYAAGARLAVLDGGLAVDGEIPHELREKIRAHREGLLEALAGDPLEGFGWEARTALHGQALRWVQYQVEKMGPKDPTRTRAAVDALCRQDAADPLNAALCSGDFEGFRAALLEYVRVGLRAAKDADRGHTRSRDRRP